MNPIGLTINSRALGGAALPTLDPPTAVTATDQGEGVLRVAWADPAAVPVALKVIVKSAGVEVHNENVAGGVGHLDISLSSGAYTGSIRNLGELGVSRGSASVPFEAVIGGDFFF